MRAVLAASLALALLAPAARAELSERELFDAAERVGLVRAVHYGEPEPAPGSRGARRYRYQPVWLEDVELFKGEPAPERFGYLVVHFPIQARLHTPEHLLRKPVNLTRLPPDEDFLAYMIRDATGAWTLLEGREGLWRYPGRSRLENLRSWAKRR